jgi:hypothetical protein
MPISSNPRSGGGSTSQTAARLLIILDVLGDQVSGDAQFPTAVKRVSSLTRLEKLDFWMRNPDYLADELMTEVEANRVSRSDVEEDILRMLTGREPEFYRYPMSRYLYGAYERVDDALSILKTYGHVAHRRVADSGQLARRDYFLLEKGHDALARLRAEVPQLAWYDQQARAISHIEDAALGAAAKRRQYLQPEYKDASLGTDIPAITERARERAIQLGFIAEGVAS